MQSSIEIAIIVDTNVFTPSAKKTRDLSKLPLEEYYKILKTLKLNELNYEVDIFFPEIVLLEMISHHKQKLIKELKQLEKLNEEFDNIENIIINGYNDIDYDSYCEELKTKYFKDLKIIKIPQDKSALFENILEMSLEKKAPFLEGKSDKGFKDSILFISLLKFAESKVYDKYVLFSNDNGFINNQDKLKTYFSNYVKQYRRFEGYDKLEIEKDKKIMKYLDNELKLFKNLRQYLENTFFNELSNKYNYANYIEIGIEKFEISSCEIIEDDTTIHQISKTEFEVEIFISVEYYLPNEYDEFDDLFDIFNEKETKTKTIYETHIFKNENMEWYSDLSSREYDIEFY